MATEPTLISRTLGGDREAFAELIQGYLGLVHGIILNKVRRPDEVEDLAQDVFVKAFQELPKLRDRGKFGPWLGRIAMNQAQAWLRQRQSRRTTVTDDPKVLEEISRERPGDLLEMVEKDGILWNALDGLRPEYRQILLLFHFGRLSTTGYRPLPWHLPAHGEVAAHAGAQQPAVARRRRAARWSQRRPPTTAERAGRRSTPTADNRDRADGELAARTGVVLTSPSRARPR